MVGSCGLLIGTRTLVLLHVGFCDGPILVLLGSCEGAILMCVGSCEGRWYVTVYGAYVLSFWQYDLPCTSIR